MTGENTAKIKKQLPGHVKLVAVSKTRTAEEIKSIYETGHRVFGENKVQELTEKYSLLPKDTEWHMIGHLQSNKVKYIIPFVHLIHSVDSFKLLKEINKQAKNNNRIINCLFQVHIAKEETKFGLSPDEINHILQSDEFRQLGHIKIAGLMGMATFTNDKKQVREEFRETKNLFNQIKERFYHDNDAFRELSMGMSGDYNIAVEEGSTIVRIGSLIFGPRS